MISDEMIDAVLGDSQSTDVVDAHAAVAQTPVSMRPLDVLSVEPKLRPETVIESVFVRALLSTPR